MTIPSHFLAIYVCLASFLSFNNRVQAQTSKKEAPQYRYVFKGYLRYFDDKQSNSVTNVDNNIFTTTTRKTLLLPSIALTKYRKDGSFWEFSITDFNFSYDKNQRSVQILFQRDSFGNLVPVTDFSLPSRGTEVFTNYLGLRFERSFSLISNKNSRFQPFLGLSCDPSVSYQKVTPFSSATFQTKVFELSNTLTLTPRLTYTVSKRFLIDLNVPVSLIKFSANYRSEDNPILPTFARKTTDFNAQLLSKIWAIRLGIGYVFN